MKPLSDREFEKLWARLERGTMGRTFQAAKRAARLHREGELHDAIARALGDEPCWMHQAEKGAPPIASDPIRPRVGGRRVEAVEEPGPTM